MYVDKKPIENKTLIPVYYENQMHDNYKLEERIIRNIIFDNTKCLKDNTKLNLIVYYRSPKTLNFVMKNNLSPPKTALQQSNVVYKFSCPLPHSQAVEYVGLTQTTLSRRLTYHAQDGGIKKHFLDCHNLKPTREQLTDNTIIIDRDSDRFKLGIKEALHIIHLGPLINKQYDNFSNILMLYNHRNILDKSNKLTNQTKRNSPLETSPSDNIDMFVCDHSNPHIDLPSTDDTPPYPDMHEVLIHFGINPSNLKTVCLKDYNWDTYTINTIENETISQRIKTLHRSARHN